MSGEDGGGWVRVRGVGGCMCLSMGVGGSGCVC